MSVDLTNDVDTAPVAHARHAAPTRAHGYDHGPLINFRVINLSRIHALLAVEATRDIYTFCNGSIHSTLDSFFFKKKILFLFDFKAFY